MFKKIAKHSKEMGPAALDIVSCPQCLDLFSKYVGAALRDKLIQSGWLPKERCKCCSNTGRNPIPLTEIL